MYKPVIPPLEPKVALNECFEVYNFWLYIHVEVNFQKYLKKKHFMLQKYKILVSGLTIVRVERSILGLYVNFEYLLLNEHF